jgi:hypothetical protein
MLHMPPVKRAMQARAVCKCSKKDAIVALHCSQMHSALLGLPVIRYANVKQMKQALFRSLCLAASVSSLLMTQ